MMQNKNRLGVLLIILFVLIVVGGVYYYNFRASQLSNPVEVSTPVPLTAQNNNSSTTKVPNLASIAISASGPVSLLIVDPQGKRLGYDEKTSQNLLEIPDGSYFTDYPITSPEGDVTQGGDPSGIKELLVPPIAGEYSLNVQGLASGTSKINIWIIGPGGAAKPETISLDVVKGSVAVEKIEYSVPEQADVSISQSHTPEKPIVGEDLTYKLVVKNDGPSTLSLSKVSGILPTTIEFISAQVPSGSCDQAGNALSCDIPSVLPGNEITITILAHAKTPTQAIAGADDYNIVHVSGFEADPNEKNNSSSAVLTVLNS